MATSTPAKNHFQVTDILISTCLRNLLNKQILNIHVWFNPQTLEYISETNRLVVDARNLWSFLLHDQWRGGNLYFLFFFFTSWPISMLQSFVDWALASTITLNMVHIDCGTRKSVDRLVFCSLTSNAILVLLKQSRKRPIQHSDGSRWRRHFLRGQWKRKLKAVISFNWQWLHMCSFKNDFPN